jgi:trk system potassium uptake protein TrkH
LLHPRAIIPLKLNNKVITTDTINSVVAFIFLFMSIAVLATILLMFIGVRPIDAVGVSISGIANIGLGFGSYDTGNFYDLPIVAKWIFSFLMLLGRLELFTVLFLFTPTFWKR